ncbi:MAG: hypothetical protein KJ561_04405 [Nanoarchaeota archaeon]|nr:hypothetical protein [Nanoarchaeota archaeon]
MLKIIKNKKSFTIEPLIIIICFIVFAFVSLIFYILFGLASKVAVYDVKLGSNLSGIEGAPLLNYLKTPIEYNGKIITISELIVLAQSDKDYGYIKEKAKLYFEPIYTKTGSNSWKTWVIEMKMMPEDRLLLRQVGSTGTNQGGLSTKLMSEVNLPTLSTNSYITVKLYKKGRGTAISS